MLDRLRLQLAPRIHPEERARRARLARVVVSTMFILLGIWLAADLLFALFTAGIVAYEFGFDLAAVAVLAVGGALSFWLIRRGNVVAAGYFLATLLFGLTTLSLFLEPGHIYLSPIGFLLAITTVGAIVGGASVYPFAGASIVAVTLGWLLARSTVLSAQIPFDLTTGYIFLLRQGLLFFGAAAMIHTISSYTQDMVAGLQEQREKLSHLAQTDALTDLANRRRLIDQLNQEFSRARRYRRPLSLLYLDLDEFKEINDRFGHMFGDDILRNAARSMRAILRSTDLLARIGGDEFAVLLPETTLEGAEDVANKLGRALAASGQRLGPTVPPLTFCVGVSQLRESDDSIDDMLARADDAQYLAKSTGKAHIRTQEEVEEIAQTRPTDT